MRCARIFFVIPDRSVSFFPLKNLLECRPLSFQNRSFVMLIDAHVHMFSEKIAQKALTNLANICKSPYFTNGTYLIKEN